MQPQEIIRVNILFFDKEVYLYDVSIYISDNNTETLIYSNTAAYSLIKIPF